MNEDQIRQIIRQELQEFLGSDRYTFQKDLEIFDFRDVKLGKTTGTKFGTETDQKLAFYGTTPRIQYPSLGPLLPSVGATYDQTEVNQIRDRVVSIQQLLQAYGLEGT